jgi:hypothetical protein
VGELVTGGERPPIVFARSVKASARLPGAGVTVGELVTGGGIQARSIEATAEARTSTLN